MLVMNNGRFLMAVAGGLAALGVLVLRPGTTAIANQGDGFPQPRAIRSVNGVLYDTLEAAPSNINISGKTIPGALLYNRQYPATTWRVKPGDRIRLMLENKIPGQFTNLHFHGFHVNPNGISDNIFLEIPSGGRQGYALNIPQDHPGGLFWYHPHFHGNSNDQVHRGLAGLIVVEGDHDQLPEVRGLRERIMALEYIHLEAGQIKPSRAPREVLQLVNGVLTPSMQARPGETQFFRVGNTSSTGWFKLSVDGHKMRVLAEDGDPYTTAEDVDSFLLAPGKRVEFLVQFSGAGTYTIRNQGYKWGGGETPAADLATVNVGGEAVTLTPMPEAISDRLGQSGLLIDQVDQTRTITFDDDLKANPPKFLIDNKEFDHHRLDLKLKLGDLEEWELVNSTDDDHPFHIHVNDFVVTEINGQVVANPRLQDTASIPARGRITIRHRFDDFAGKWVMHCHILGHEDLGMMASIEVTR
jgi:FtsP/CotA-like multicopper oxidase with cupredoxin domain